MLNTHRNSGRSTNALRHLGPLVLAVALVVSATAITLSPSEAASITNSAAKSDRAVTYAMPEDYLDVTLAPAAGSISDDPLDSDLSIWVGEVELNNEKQIWVELIDAHGEVIYDSQVRENETHMLPDGRALVVRARSVEAPVVATTSPTAEKDQARIETNAERIVVTHQNVETTQTNASIEFVKEQPVHPLHRQSFMERAGENGETVKKALVSLVN